MSRPRRPRRLRAARDLHAELVDGRRRMGLLVRIDSDRQHLPCPLVR
jgi:hypothetical protein